MQLIRFEKSKQLNIELNTKFRLLSTCRKRALYCKFVFKNILHIGTAKVMPQTTKGAPCGCALKAIEKHGRATSRLLADVGKDAAVDVENVSVDEV